MTDTNTQVPSNQDNGMLDKLEVYMKVADEYILKIPDAGRLADVLGIRPFYLPVMVTMSLATLFGIFEAFFVSLMATVYPAYASYKAIRSPKDDDDKQWLTYWVAYALINTVDSVLAATLQVVGLRIPPLIALLKVATLCWLSYFKGSLLVWRWLEPHVERAEPQIDRFMSSFVTPDEGIERADSLIDKATDLLSKYKNTKKSE